jgi:WD40 repeat protein
MTFQLILAAATIFNAQPAAEPLPTGVFAGLGASRMDIGADVGSARFTNDGAALTVAPGRYSGIRSLSYLDLTTGKITRRIELPEGPREHAFTPDERLLIVRTFYQTSHPTKVGAVSFAEIHVLDAATGRSIWKTDAEQEFESMALSPDGKLLAGGIGARAGEASDIVLWDTATGKQHAVLAGHRTAIRRLAFSIDGKRLLSASEDDTPVASNEVVKGNVYIWNVATSQRIKNLSCAGADHVASPTGETIAFKNARRSATKVTLWDTNADRPIAELRQSDAGYRFTPDGKALVTGSGTDMLRFWDAATGRELRRFEGVVGNGVHPLAFSGDGKRLATFGGPDSYDTAIRLWDVTTGTERTPTAGHRLDITCLMFDRDGKTLVSGSQDRTVRLWQIATGAEIRSYANHDATITAVALAGDGRTVASADASGSTHLWDARTGKLLHRIAPDPAPKDLGRTIELLRFAPDDKELWIGSHSTAINEGVSRDEKGELARHDVATGKRIAFQSSDAFVPRAISPDGSLAVWTERLKPRDRFERDLAVWQEKVVVRRVDTGRELFEIAAAPSLETTLISQALFSPDSRTIALSSHWAAVSFHRCSIVPCYRLVDASNGKDLVNKSSADYPWTIHFPGGRVAAGSYEIENILAPAGGMIRVEQPSLAIVDPLTGKKLGKLPSYPTRSSAWAVSPNAAFVAAVSDRRTILVWDLAAHGVK